MKPETVLKATLLLAAFASFLLSVTLYFQAGDNVLDRMNGLFVGIWVPSILTLGAFILAGTRRRSTADSSEPEWFAEDVAKLKGAQAAEGDLGDPAKFSGPIG